MYRSFRLSEGGPREDSHRFKRANGALSIALVGAVVLGTFVAGCGDGEGPREATQGSSESGPLINTIVVSGLGKVTAAPDEATIQVGVQNDGATSAEALDANSKDTRMVSTAQSRGIATRSTDDSVVVYPTLLRSTSGKEIFRYRAQNVTVTFHDLAISAHLRSGHRGGPTAYTALTWQLSKTAPRSRPR